MAKAGRMSRKVAITAHNSTVVEAGDLFVVNCSGAGNVTVRLESGDTHVIPVAEGYSAYPYGVVGVNTTGTTATATYENLISG